MRYVPSENNPDDGARGYKACNITTGSPCIKRLAWAGGPLSDWPAHLKVHPLTDFLFTGKQSRPTSNFSRQLASIRIYYSRHPVILNAEEQSINLLLHAYLWKNVRNIFSTAITMRPLRQEPIKPSMAGFHLLRLAVPFKTSLFLTTGAGFIAPFARKDRKFLSKIYVFIFTFLVTRAVRTEICNFIIADCTL